MISVTNTAKAKVIDGRALSETMRGEIAEQAAAFTQQTGVTPGLAVVLVGSDPASEVYVRMKGKAAEKAGFHSQQITLPADTTEAHLLGIIDGLNSDARVHGILVGSRITIAIDQRFNDRAARRCGNAERILVGAEPYDGRLAASLL